MRSKVWSWTSWINHIPIDFRFLVVFLEFDPIGIFLEKHCVGYLCHQNCLSFNWKHFKWCKLIEAWQFSLGQCAQWRFRINCIGAHALYYQLFHLLICSFILILNELINSHKQLWHQQNNMKMTKFISNKAAVVAMFRFGSEFYKHVFAKYLLRFTNTAPSQSQWVVSEEMWKRWLI